MDKLQELMAKLAGLKTKASALEDADEINAIIAEIQDVKAQIVVEEMKVEDERVAAENKIKSGAMKPIENSKDDDGLEVDNEATYSAAFYNALRGKDLTSDEKYALSEGSGATGGYTVPKSFRKKLIEKLEEMNIMRKLGNVITTESDLDIPVVATTGSADWTAENGAYNESEDTFGQVTLKAYKLTRIIKVSEELLEDSAFDLEGYLVKSFARAISKPEENAFISGDGTEKPQGVFVGAEVGVTAASATAITSDELIDLFYSLARAYRQNASWIMNDTTAKAVRKLKDSNGDYLWSKGLAGEPDKILGKPFYTSEFAPEIALGNKAIAFGDMSYYEIADRSKRVFQRLNELYSANGQVGFRGRERVDGKLTLAEAVKVLQMAAV